MPMQGIEGGQTSEGVVLLHGFGGLPLQTALLARRLRQRGYAVLNPLYPSWRWPLERIVDHVHRRVIPFADGRSGKLHFVGHSMGGLVLRAYLARHRPQGLGHVVMLGTPNGGSELADLLHRLRLNGPVLNRAGRVLRTVRAPEVEALLGSIDYPAGVIAGNTSLAPLLPDMIFRAPHDGKVSVAATFVAGQADHLVLPVAHTSMLYARPVAEQVIHFLRFGQFRPIG